MSHPHQASRNRENPTWGHCMTCLYGRTCTPSECALASSCFRYLSVVCRNSSKKKFAISNTARDMRVDAQADAKELWCAPASLLFARMLCLIVRTRTCSFCKARVDGSWRWKAEPVHLFKGSKDAMPHQGKTCLTNTVSINT